MIWFTIFPAIPFEWARDLERSSDETGGVSRALLTASFVWKVVLKFSSVEIWTEGNTCSFYSTIVLRPNKSFIRNRSSGVRVWKLMEISRVRAWIVCALIDNTMGFRNTFLRIYFFDLLTEKRRDS